MPRYDWRDTPDLRWLQRRLMVMQIKRVPQQNAWCWRPPDTFTLHVWIRTGRGVERRYVPDLSEPDCTARSKKVREGTKWRVETHCIRTDHSAESATLPMRGLHDV